ncbi:hypothetical protein Sm713_09660 [Streptomyces sp. TS71-3]|nr:hypothetical protein Sm713_09660 [Streptomyces sp. TS71-3]
MVGLLFLALLVFAFGKADTSRSGTQSAADAAALAAAQDSRDQFKTLFLENVLNGGWLRDLLNGDRIGTYNGCTEADRFASLNDAGQVQCSQLSDGRWGFHVQVTSNKPMGKSIIPGTEDKHAESSATAVVEPRCGFEPDPDATESPSPLPQNNGGTSGDDKGDKKPSPGKITCDDRDFQIDPDHLDLLPDMADLFTVRLAED